MIIWSRWGVVVFVFFGLSVGMGFAMQSFAAPVAGPNAPVNPAFFGVGFLLGATALWAFAKYVLPKLDKATPSFILERLAEPVVSEHGGQVTHRRVAVVNQETGQQIWTRPTSTFFFIPVRFWVYPLALVGLVSIITGLIGL